VIALRTEGETIVFEGKGLAVEKVIQVALKAVENIA
jgi:hypothetical protein